MAVPDDKRGSAGITGIPLERLAPAEADRWRQKLEKTAHPCGCKSGAAFALVALLAFPVGIAVSGMARTLLRDVVVVLAYPVVVVALGLVGKVAGIVVGRWRYRSLRRRLTRRLAVPSLMLTGRYVPCPSAGRLSDR